MAHRKAAGVSDTVPSVGDKPGPVHFLDGLRCPTCRTLNASWLTGGGEAVECAECGQTSLVIGPEGAAA